VTCFTGKNGRMATLGEETLRATLVDLLRDRVPHASAEVLAAFRFVPRHLFVPAATVAEAYADEAIVTRRDADDLPTSSSSQPTIMALMLEQLGIQPGDRVLEIGAGTGYNAALMAYLAGRGGSPAGRVVTLDIDPETVAAAAGHLVKAGFPEVEVVCGDGADGHPEAAPYDRIIATVGVWEIPQAWARQLAPGGRIVAPLDLGGVQLSVALERQGDTWRSVSAVPCGFMRLRGPAAGPERTVSLDSRLKLALPRGGSVPDVLTFLGGEPVRRASGVSGGPLDVFGGIGLRIATGEARACALWEKVSDAEEPYLAEPVIRFGDMAGAPGLLDDDGIAVLTGDDGDGFGVFGHGSSGGRLADDLVRHVQTWDAAGRPDADRLVLTVLPLDAETPTGATVMPKRHTKILVEFAPAP
jgi:protein-L-isoaspartate(D-aspartate) O-methyltransferase